MVLVLLSLESWGFTACPGLKLRDETELRTRAQGPREAIRASSKRASEHAPPRIHVQSGEAVA